MIIPITFPSRSTESNVDSPRLPPQLAKLGHDEFVLIELQGSLSVEGVAATRGQLVGTLRVDESKPTLTIGHHLLEGKITNLPKPIAVLHRSTSSGSEDGSTTPGWDVVAVVKRKIVFSKRPMPLVG